MRATKELSQKKPIVLISFIALSLLVHGVLFLFQTSPQDRLVKNSLGTQKLSISLVSSDNSADTNANKSINNRTQTPKHTATVKKPIKAVSTTHMLTRATVKNSKQLSTYINSQRNFLLGEIQHRLSRYLSYPVKAQRRGWQGEVMVGFHVDKKGFLHNVHLSQSSGYSLLDNAALSAIGKVKYIPLPSSPETNHENEFYPTALLLPVSYRLINS